MDDGYHSYTGIKDVALGALVLGVVIASLCAVTPESVRNNSVPVAFAKSEAAQYFRKVRYTPGYRTEFHTADTLYCMSVINEADQPVALSCIKKDIYGRET